jgi:hypothetical protein
MVHDLAGGGHEDVVPVHEEGLEGFVGLGVGLGTGGGAGGVLAATAPELGPGRAPARFFSIGTGAELAEKMFLPLPS